MTSMLDDELEHYVLAANALMLAVMWPSGAVISFAPTAQLGGYARSRLNQPGSNE